MAIHETSYGIIPLSKFKKQWKLLLVRHGKGHWAFPKGHAKEEETPLEAATRELFEETGLKVKRVMDMDPIQESYVFTWKGKKVFKKVVYFLAEVEGVVKLQIDEISDYKWVLPEEGEHVATFAETKKICRHVQNLLS